MSISSARVRALAVEAFVAGLLAAGAALVWSPADPWLTGAAFHPAWLAVLVLAARYGRRGLLAALPVTWTVVAVTSLLVGAPLEAAAARLTGAADLGAMIATVIVAWVASIHHARQAELASKLAEADARAQAETETFAAMREALVTLRARNDRIDLSLSFWRDIATRLESRDPVQAARAALDLSLARTGARAGIVRRLDGGHLHTMAWRGGCWSARDPIPRDIFPDRTIGAALERRAVTVVRDLADPGVEDSDVAAPVIGHDGALLGVIALRGVAPGRLQEAELRDLALVSGWIAGALAVEQRDPAPHSAAAASDHAPGLLASEAELEPVAAVAGARAIRPLSRTTAPPRPRPALFAVPAPPEPVPARRAPRGKRLRLADRERAASPATGRSVIWG